MINGQSLNLKEGVHRKALIIPDALTLSDMLALKPQGKIFAIILNEYAMVMGVITLNDVMTTLMGDLVYRSRRANRQS